MASVFVAIGTELKKIGEGVEVAAEDAMKLLTEAEAKAPAATAALGVVAGAVTSALANISTTAAEATTSPATLTITIPADIASIKTAWTDVEAFLATIGIKI